MTDLLGCAGAASFNQVTREKDHNGDDDHELKRTTRYPDPTLTSRPRDMGKVELSCRQRYG